MSRDRSFSRFPHLRHLLPSFLNRKENFPRIISDKNYLKGKLSWLLPDSGGKEEKQNSLDNLMRTIYIINIGFPFNKESFPKERIVWAKKL